MKNKSAVFPSQLTFLTFAYVYGGLALHRADGFFTVIGCVAVAAASASLGSLVACDGRGIRRALARLFPRSAETEAAAALAALCSAPLVADILAFGNYSSEVYQNPTLFPLFSMTAIILSSVLCRKLKSIGRLAEILAFCAIPYSFVLLFGKFTPHDVFFPALTGLASWGSIAVPIAICMQTTAENDGKYHDLMPNTLKTQNKNVRLAANASVGALLGGILYLFSSFFVFSAGNVAQIIFVWSSAMIRISSSFFALKALCNGKHSTVVASVFTVASILALVSIAKKTLPFVAGAIEMLNVFSLLIIFCVAMPSFHKVRQSA